MYLWYIWFIEYKYTRMCVYVHLYVLCICCIWIHTMYLQRHFTLSFFLPTIYFFFDVVRLHVILLSRHGYGISFIILPWLTFSWQQVSLNFSPQAALLLQLPTFTRHSTSYRQYWFISDVPCKVVFFSEDIYIFFLSSLLFFFLGGGLYNAFYVKTRKYTFKKIKSINCFLYLLITIG